VRVSDLRVVDLSAGIAGAYCTKLLADAGADVVAAEAPPIDRETVDRGPVDTGLRQFLLASKRSVSPARGERLARAAHLVVAGGSFDPSEALRDDPARVVVSITPFGRSGPWVGRPATEFTLQAACGSTGGRGLPGEPPLAAGGGVGEWLTGAYAAVGALSAAWRVSRTGLGGLVDVALLDCMALGMATFPSVFADFAAACGRRPVPATTRRIEVPSVEPTADGWVNFTTNSAQQFADFATLIGHPEITEDPRFVRAMARFENREAFWELTRAYTRPRSSQTVLDEAGLLRIPVAPVLEGSSVLSFPHFVERGVFVENPTGGFLQPRSPYRLHGVEHRELGPAPEPGEHDATVDWPAADREPDRRRTGSRTDRDAMGEEALPLRGTRVVDLTAWWAGPSATHVLAALGADVVKVESTVRPDLMRFSSVKGPGEERWWEWGPLAHAVNTNKRGVTMDLTKDEGRDLASRLFATADLVVENYTPRVMEQFGFDWNRLHALNPRLCVVRMPAFGLDGPWRDRPGFAQTMESLTGLAAGTGWPDGSPVLVGGAADPISGLHATFAALVALCARSESGRGYLVESTMVEAALNAATPALLASQLTGRTPGRVGNRSTTGSAPQGAYPCAAEDTWVAIEVESDDQWARLCDVLGTDGLDAATSLASRTARRAREDELDRWLRVATRAWDAGDLAERLAASGVPAAAVIRPPEIAANPQIRHREMFEVEDHPLTGRHRLPGLPFRMDGVAAWVRAPSPLLGEHNDEVLGELGVEADARADLRARGIIGEDLAQAR
jgi:crotonobetainyl-CoA:carnitine CoA-transferase CaiB-like acyl-CoA transferase